MIVGALLVSACGGGSPSSGATGPVASVPPTITPSTQTQTPEPSSFTKQEVKQVDFGAGANYFSIKAASAGSGGEVELRLDSAKGQVIGRAFMHHTGSPLYFLDYEAKLNATITGVRSVYFNILDYSAPTTGGILKTGEFKFSKLNTDAPVSKDSGFSLYPAVPGMAASPYYEFRIQEKSKLNSTNLADVTNWQSPFAWFTECPEKGVPSPAGGFFSSYVGGWSHSFTNFQLAPNTPIVVKVSRKGTNALGAPAGPIKRAAVYPARKTQSMELINGDVYITMNNPAQITVDIDGQMDTRNAPRATPSDWGSEAFPYLGRAKGSHAVSIFANPFITAPDKSDPGVLVIQAGQKLPANLADLNWHTLYFDSGIHKASVDVNASGELVERRWKPEDQIPIISNRKYYIAGDAIVYGNFTDYNKKTGPTQNVRFFGHGAVSGEKITHYKSWPDYPNGEYPNSELHRGIVLRDAENSHIEGLTLLNAANHNTEITSSNSKEYLSNSVKWIKVIGWRVNSDAASVGGRVTMEDSFFRTQDDTHYIGGASPMRRMVFWNDVNGQAFRSDFATDRIRVNDAPSQPKQILIEDIDILYARGVFSTGDPITGLIGAEGGMPGRILANGVVNTGQMILFRNVLISDPLPTRSLFAFDAKDKQDRYAGFRFENVTYVGKPAFGWKHTLLGGVAGLGNFVFDNVSIDGKKIDAQYINDPANFRTDRIFDLTFRAKDQIAQTPYTLSKTATNGSIQLDSLQAGGDQLTVRAVPIAGFKFIGWSGDISGTDSIATITMNRDKSITAIFAPL
jgi:Divergent InlB B-repeat domain/Carbohydrate binding module (family 6)